MRVVAVGQIAPHTLTVVSEADHGADLEYVIPAFVDPLPQDGERILCWRCLRWTHLWIDATHISRSSGQRMRLICCSRCFIEGRAVRDCEIHAMSSAVRPEHLQYPRWPSERPSSS
ncbi:hypothetical protein DP939_43020 [Spongiactinospora rosea]|uniref:Uncharacterized protein n=2 Tax=Spongiactinospora rosea TaxID=2248750 RepID=A0A366LKK0_9ACTN|nr:hypothetical protein DP939_43020 [Spongiactinospora rosea]